MKIASCAHRVRLRSAAKVSYPKTARSIVFHAMNRTLQLSVLYVLKLFHRAVSHTKISHFIGNVSHVQTAISHWLVNDLLQEMSIHIVLNALANCSPKSAMLALNQLPVS